MKYNEKNQVHRDECNGKIIESTEILNNSQLVITFTDGTHMTVSARISDNKPFVGTRITTGQVESEWK